MSKRKYKSVRLHSLDLGKIEERAAGARLAVGIDLAKEELYAAVMTPALEVLQIIRWRQPKELQDFVEVAKLLAEVAEEVAFVMEPSGVYGDPLRQALCDAGLTVRRVSPKRSHDAAEVYDGVPSLHDAKCAAIIAKLHFDGASEDWGLRTDHERRLAASLRVMEVFEKEFRRNRNRLEGLLFRFWPELGEILKLGSATMLELLVSYGGPRAVAEAPDEARQLMRQVGGGFLDPAKVEAVIASASATVGMRQLDDECVLVSVVAQEARRNQQMSRRARKRVEELTADDDATKVMREVVGKTSAAVLVAAVGSPVRYDSAYAYLKSLGLNLKEISSGKRKKGQLHITRRGPGIARLFLYLAALRLIKSDPVVRAWYAKKVARQGGQAKNKAVIAVVRKLAKALWHIARDQAPFDSSRLFDVQRLKVA